MQRIAIALVLCTGLSAGAWDGLVDFDGTELGLIGYTNPSYTYGGPGFGTDANLVSGNQFGMSIWSPGDAFWPMTRADLGPNLPTGMPFGISDDSVVAAAGNSVFASDTQGFAGMAFENNGFFGIIDTENLVNQGPIVAEFVFDVTGMSNISVNADFVAMGDFEATDTHAFEYSFDGVNFFPLFTAFIDEAGMQTYLMDNPANNPVVKNDPMLINGVLLDDNFQNISAAVVGTGTSLTIRYTAMQDSGSEGVGFDNLAVVPEPSSLVLLGLSGLLLRRRR